MALKRCMVHVHHMRILIGYDIWPQQHGSLGPEGEGMVLQPHARAASERYKSSEDAPRPRKTLNC